MLVRECCFKCFSTLFHVYKKRINEVLFVYFSVEIIIYFLEKKSIKKSSLWGVFLVDGTWCNSLGCIARVYGGTCRIRTGEPRFCRPVYWTTLARCHVGCVSVYTNSDSFFNSKVWFCYKCFISLSICLLVSFSFNTCFFSTFLINFPTQTFNLIKPVFVIKISRGMIV